MNRSLLLAVVSLALAGCAAQGPDGVPRVSPAQAGIPFGEFGNIYDWRADGSAGIFIQSDDHQWYYATFISPCTNLAFTEHVGFRTTPPLPLTKFDSIEVRRKLLLQEFGEVGGPAGHRTRKRLTRFGEFRVARP